MLKYPMTQTTIIKNQFYNISVVVVLVLILFSVACDIFDKPENENEKETKAITLSISAPGINDVSLPLTLTGGAVNSGIVYWKPEYQNKEITITKSGDGSAFTTLDTRVDLAVKPNPAGTTISTADRTNLSTQFANIRSQLEAMGATASYVINVQEVPSYPIVETRNITINISRDGTPLPKISATLTSGQNATGTFQWVPAHQNANSFTMFVGGNTTAFTESNASFTLNIAGNPSGTMISESD
jgi:hypothetical protein